MAAAGRFLDRLAPGDRVGLANIPRGGPNVEFTSDLARVRQALGRVVGANRRFGQPATSACPRRSVLSLATR